MTVAKVKTDEDLLVCTISNSSNHEKYQTPTYYFWYCYCWILILTFFYTLDVCLTYNIEHYKKNACLPQLSSHGYGDGG
jgi:hypothetical protein